jgi:hypothetical protein
MDRRGASASPSAAHMSRNRRPSAIAVRTGCAAARASSDLRAHRRAFQPAASSNAPTRSVARGYPTRAPGRRTLPGAWPWTPRGQPFMTENSGTPRPSPGRASTAAPDRGSFRFLWAGHGVQGRVIRRKLGIALPEIPVTPCVLWKLVSGRSCRRLENLVNRKHLVGVADETNEATGQRAQHTNPPLLRWSCEFLSHGRDMCQ